MNEPRVGQRGPKARLAGCLFYALLCRKRASKGLRFVGSHPFRVFRTIAQIEIGPYTDRGRKQSLDEEHELPAMQAEQALMLQKQPRERATQHQRERRSEIKDAEDLPARACGKPVRHVKDRAWNNPASAAPRKKRMKENRKSLFA